MTEKVDQNPDFQGFSEDFGGVFPVKPALSREAQEMLGEMQKRLKRVQRTLPTYRRNAPKALRDEEEALLANIAHFKRRWGLTEE